MVVIGNIFVNLSLLLFTRPPGQRIQSWLLPALSSPQRPPAPPQVKVREYCHWDVNQGAFWEAKTTDRRHVIWETNEATEDWVLERKEKYIFSKLFSSFLCSVS